MIIGLTGTRKGMTAEQKFRVSMEVSYYQPKEVHHGDAIGADSQFHDIVLEKVQNPYIIIHPPTNPKYRAFRKGHIILPEKPYLARDDDIILASDLMLATPHGKEEILRSGTWATIRHTRKFKKPLIIIHFDGTIEVERLDKLKERKQNVLDF
jgi:hypothetical protein